MNDIEKMVSEFVELLEEIEDDEVKGIVLILFLSSCGMNEEEIAEYLKSLIEENE